MGIFPGSHLFYDAFNPSYIYTSNLRSIDDSLFHIFLIYLSTTPFPHHKKFVLPMSSTQGSPYVGIQIGKLALPAQIKYHGYPGVDESKQKTRSAEVYIFDEETIETLRKYEASVQSEWPTLSLNSIFSEEEGNTCIRMKFTKLSERFSSEVDGVKSLEDLQYGDLFLSKSNVKKWQMGGSCGIVLYANIVKCVGRADTPVGRPFHSKLNWD